MSLGDLFKKRSGREKYDTLEKDVEGRKSDIEGGPPRMEDGPFYEFLAARVNYTIFRGMYLAAERALKRLYKSQHTKAIRLDEKYTALARNLERDAAKLHRFEEQELGMPHNKPRKIEGTLILIFIITGIFFLSPNFTGNVIGNMTNSSSNILGVVLLVLGLVGNFFWIRSRK